MPSILRRFACVLFVWACVALIPDSASAQFSDKEKELYQSLSQSVGSAQQLIRAKKFEEAAAKVVEAEKILAEMKGLNNPLLNRVLTQRRVGTLVGNLRSVLEKRDVKFPGDNTPGPDKPTTTTPTDGISFMKEVAPMLAGKCGRCHMGNASRGQFSMETFTQLMRGAGGSLVIAPGDGKGSRLVEVIASGDMPRGGGRVSKEELDKLIAWIDAGAKFDGPNRGASLSATAQPNRPNRVRLEATQATGNEKIQFSRDIAPVLLAKCTNCHGGDRPRGDLGMDSFARLLRGGDSGAPLMPGKGEESLIVKKLRGTADGNRMPQGGPPLPEETIKKFVTWIDEGAKFDGPDPNMQTETVAAMYQATVMSHDELSAKRKELAMDNWKLANPETEAKIAETPNFRVIGNLPESRLQEIGNQAEDLAQKVAQLLKAPANEPLLKGKLTLFAFQRYFEYSEFGTMVEKRSLPRDWRGHARYTVIDAYAALAPPREEKDTFERTLIETIASAYIESLGKVPAWFSQGVARAISAKLEPKSPVIQDWQERLPGIASSGDPARLFRNEMNLSDAGVMSYAVGKQLVSNTGALQKLLQALKQGQQFEAAFKAAYGGEPSRLLGSSRGRRRR